ncbi:MAG: hypothetical protein JXR97_13920, partial [Planctomycetes bacterium]|nr:hypothetical protein [Planctomycetota bacterium]
MSESQAAFGPEDFIEIPCPACGSRGFREVFPARFSDMNGAFDYLHEEDMHYRVVTCNNCGQVYSNPILTPETVEELYRNCDHGDI